MRGLASLPGPVLIVGTGLIGASLGLALRRRGTAVWLDDVDANALQVAVSRGAGERAVQGSQPWCVVVAVPPGATANVVADRLLRHPSAVVTDVASVKGPIERNLREAAADMSRYVGGHPMAGREVSGAGAARADLLTDRPWVVTPHPEASRRAVDALEALACAVGALPVTMPANEHDKAVAVISHAPQVLSSLLAARLLDASDGAARIAGQGLRDMTRIAASDPVLWREILAANAEEVRRVLRGIHADLGVLLGALESVDDGGAEELEALLRRGNAGRERVPGRHGKREKPPVLVPVSVPDRAGELGRLFADVAAAGASVEDVWIEHSLGRPTGVVEIAVDPQVAAGLADALSAAGWDVRG